MILKLLIDWLIGRSINWLINVKVSNHWLIGLLVGWLVDWLMFRFTIIDWLINWLVDWLIDWLMSRFTILESVWSLFSSLPSVKHQLSSAQVRHYHYFIASLLVTIPVIYLYYSNKSVLGRPPGLFAFLERGMPFCPWTHCGGKERRVSIPLLSNDGLSANDNKNLYIIFLNIKSMKFVAILIFIWIY